MAPKLHTKILGSPPGLPAAFHSFHSSVVFCFFPMVHDASVGLGDTRPEMFSPTKPRTVQALPSDRVAIAMGVGALCVPSSIVPDQ